MDEVMNELKALLEAKVDDARDEADHYRALIADVDEEVRSITALRGSLHRKMAAADELAEILDAAKEEQCSN